MGVQGAPFKKSSNRLPRTFFQLCLLAHVPLYIRVIGSLHFVVPSPRPAPCLQWRFPVLDPRSATSVNSLEPSRKGKKKFSSYSGGGLEWIERKITIMFRLSLVCEMPISLTDRQAVFIAIIITHNLPS